MARKCSSMVPTMASIDLEEELSIGEEVKGDWELVNNSDAEYSDDSFSVCSLPNDDIASWNSFSLSSSSSLLPTQNNHEQETHQDLDDYALCQDDGNLKGRAYDVYLEGRAYDMGYQYNRYGYNYDEEDEEEGDGDGYDLDDELVPRSVSGKLGRQRMRKLGKRAFKKMNTSKRSPYLYVKPGCVHGKHGLGMKHCL